MKNEAKQIYTLPEICDKLGIKFPTYENTNFSDLWSEEYESYVDSGMDEAKAELKASEVVYADWERYETQAIKYLDTVLDDWLKKIKLDYQKPTKTSYKIVPEDDWKDSCKEILDVINGMGYYHYMNLNELLKSGPYTPKQCALLHIHLVNDYGEVYGDGSPARDFQRMLEK